MSIRDVPRKMLAQLRFVAAVVRHPRTPNSARFVAGCALAYVLSPIQLIPNFIPVIGQMDDLIVLVLTTKLLLKLTPSDVCAECRSRPAIKTSAEVDKQPAA